MKCLLLDTLPFTRATDVSKRQANACRTTSVFVVLFVSQPLELCITRNNPIPSVI